MEGQRLPAALNPSHFPAKLWELVNSPRCGSVRWDARGEGLLIDQRLFERELLGAEAAGDGAALDGEVFKTRNFASFIRQLNLYGFRKLGPGPGPLQDPAGGDGGSSAGALLHFYSPHFRRDRPELLVNLKRLTRANKAKLAAGLELPSRPAQRSQLPPSTLGEAARPGELGWPRAAGPREALGAAGFLDRHPRRQQACLTLLAAAQLRRCGKAVVVHAGRWAAGRHGERGSRVVPSAPRLQDSLRRGLQ